MSALTDAVALLRQYQEQIEAEHERMKAEMLMMEFIEQAGGVVEATEQLERDYELLQERFEALQDRYDLLLIETHRRTCDAERAAGGPGEGGAAMSEFGGQYYVEKIDASSPCVRLEPIFNASVAGNGIRALVIETYESTPLASMWGASVASCHRFHVVIRRVG